MTTSPKDASALSRTNDFEKINGKIKKRSHKHHRGEPKVSKAEKTYNHQGRLDRYDMEKKITNAEISAAKAGTSLPEAPIPAPLMETQPATLEDWATLEQMNLASGVKISPKSRDQAPTLDTSKEIKAGQKDQKRRLKERYFGRP